MRDTISQASTGKSFHLTSLLQGGTSVLAASVVGNGLNYLFLLFLARQLGMEDFGLYALGLTLFNTLVPVLTAGLDTATIKFTAGRCDHGDSPGSGRTLAAAIALAAACGGGAAFMLMVTADPLASRFYSKPALAAPLLLFAAALPASIVSGIVLAALQGHGAMRSFILVKYLWEPLGKWMAAGVAVLTGWGLLGIVGGLAATGFISLLLAWRALNRVAPISVNEWGAVGKEEFLRLAAYCGPLVVSNLFGVVAPRMDLMTLGYWASSREVGLYLAAFQTAAVLALVLGAFDAVFAPMMSQAWAAQDRRALANGYRAVHRLALMVAVPLFVLLCLFGGECLALFGAEFPAGAAVLAILACGQVVNCATGSSNTVLLMAGQTRLVMMNTILYGLFLIAGTMWLVPQWGALGAAWAASLCFVALNFFRVWQAWRLHGIWPWGPATLKPFAAGLCMAVFLSAVKWAMPPVLHLPAIVTGCLLYLMVLYAIRLDADDQRALASTWSRLRLAWN